MFKLFSSCVLLLTCVSMGLTAYSSNIYSALSNLQAPSAPSAPSNPTAFPTPQAPSVPLDSLPNISLSSIPGLEDIQGTVSVAFLEYLTNPQDLTFVDFVNKSTDAVTLTIRSRSNTIGIVTLPFNAMCKPPGSNFGVVAQFFDQLVQYVTCNVCGTDCLAGHNKYGGACRNPDSPYNTVLEGNITCYCAKSPEVAAKMGIQAPLNNTAANCKSLLPSLLTLASSDAFINSLFFQVIRRRYDVVLCRVQETAGTSNITCSDDCVANHQYHNNITHQCIFEPINVVMDDYNTISLLDGQPKYCECGNYTTD